MSFINTKTEIGTLLSFDSAENLRNCDGYGYYCRKIEDNYYKSSILYNANYEILKILYEQFTHILWYYIFIVNYKGKKKNEN